MARRWLPLRRSASHEGSTIPLSPRMLLLLSCGSGRLPSELDAVVFYEKPFIKFERLLETYVSTAPRGFRTVPPVHSAVAAREALSKGPTSWGASQDRHSFRASRLRFCEHHLSHAASAFFPSPFRRALILTLDGVGEWATTSASIGHDHSIEVHAGIHFPHSLGLLYSAFTYYAGFKVNSGEYKLMGLAPVWGAPALPTDPRHLIDLKPDGTSGLTRNISTTHRADDDERALSRRCSAGRRGPEIAPQPVPHGPCRLYPGGHGRVVLRLTAGARGRDGRAESLSGGRRGAELCGQRKNFARRPFNALGPTRGRRRRRRARRCPGRLPHGISATRETAGDPATG